MNMHVVHVVYDGTCFVNIFYIQSAYEKSGELITYNLTPTGIMSKRNKSKRNEKNKGASFWTPGYNFVYCLYTTLYISLDTFWAFQYAPEFILMRNTLYLYLYNIVNTNNRNFSYLLIFEDNKWASFTGKQILLLFHKLITSEMPNVAYPYASGHYILKH